jgi:nucleotide-binding universal stress UspA family protein
MEMTSHDIPVTRKVIVGVDGSAPSKAALRWAARICERTGNPIEAVIAWEWPRSYGWSPMLEEWHPDAEAEKMLQQTLDDVFGSQRPAGVVASVRHGAPRNVLIEASDGAEMLVVGSRGHGGFTGLLLGSVSAACAEHAHCPVVVVREPRAPATA